MLGCISQFYWLGLGFALLGRFALARFDRSVSVGARVCSQGRFLSVALTFGFARLGRFGSKRLHAHLQKTIPNSQVCINTTFLKPIRGKHYLI